MAMATEPSSSPSSSSSSVGPHPPQFLHESRGLPSPWSHVVVHGVLEVTTAAPRTSRSQPPPPAAIAPPEPSDRSPPTAAAADDVLGVAAPPPPPTPHRANEGDGDHAAAAAARGKRTAWKRPSSGVIEAGAVMGAASWPALSEAAKGTPKSSSPDPLKGLSEGCVPSPPPLPAPVTTTSPPPRQIANNSNFISSANNASPTGQRSMKRGDSGSSGSTVTGNNGSALPNIGPVPAHSLLPSSAEVPEDAVDKPGTPRPSFRDPNHGNISNWEHGSRGGGCSPQSHGGNEYHRNFGGHRRVNHSGGGGPPYHNKFVNRRGLERGGHDWNNRSLGGSRDMQVQQQQQQQPMAMARPFLQPLPSGSAPFISPPAPVRPFAGPMGYYEIPSPLYYVPPHPPPESHGGMPFVGPPAMFYATPDSQLRAMLAKQIDYYFSPENLCKDIYLRQNMDEEGWVSISLIASFNRVKNLTNNIQFILDTVRTSTIVEVQGDKIRRRNGWVNWPPLASAFNPPRSSTNLSYDSLAAHVKNVKLAEGSTSQNSMRGAICTQVMLSRSSSDLISQSPEVTASSGIGADPALTCSDHSVSARSLLRCDTF